MMDFIFKIDWNAMITPGISILDKGFRALIIYLVLILGFRIAGKRELAQLNPFDIVVLFLLSNTVQNALIGNDNSLIGGITGAAVLFIINYIIVRFMYDNKKIETIVEGSCDILIENGVVKYDKLKKEIITLSEMEMAAHKQGFSSLDEIETAEIDPDGAISFIAKKPTQDETHYKELLSKLDDLNKEVRFLRDKLEKN